MAREWYSRPINSGYTVVDGYTTGNYNNGATDTYVKTWMEYKVVSQDQVNNTTTIDAKLYSQVIDGGSASGMSNTFTANNYGYVGFDNGSQQYLSTTYNFNSYALNKFADSTLTIPHNPDGTKTITLQGSFTTLAGTWAITGGSASASVTLPTIPRMTQISSVTGLNYGYATTIVLNRQASNLRELVTLTNGGTTLTLKDTSSADTTFTYTLDRAYTPNTTKPSPSTWTLTVATYNGGTLIGSIQTTLTFTIYGNDTSYHVNWLQLPTCEAYNDVVVALGTDTAVAGYSKLNVKANKADLVPQYNATIASRVVTFSTGDVVSADQTDHISSKITSAGAVTWRYTVTDSRGFDSYYERTYTVINSSAPTFTTLNCFRGDNLGNPVDGGAYIWCLTEGRYDSLNGHNYIAITASIDGGAPISLSNNIWTYIKTDAVATQEYHVTFTIQDILTYTQSTIDLPSASIPINIREGGKGVGIGAYGDADDRLKIGYNVLATKEIREYTDHCVANTYGGSTYTLNQLINALRSHSGAQFGSVYLYTFNDYGAEIAESWYHYEYIPHRTGDNTADNNLYGSLILRRMVGNPAEFYIRWTNVSNSPYIQVIIRNENYSLANVAYDAVNVCAFDGDVCIRNGVVTISAYVAPANAILAGTPLTVDGGIPYPITWHPVMLGEVGGQITSEQIAAHNQYGRLQAVNNLNGTARSLTMSYVTRDAKWYMVR